MLRKILPGPCCSWVHLLLIADAPLRRNLGRRARLSYVHHSDIRAFPLQAHSAIRLRLITVRRSLFKGIRGLAPTPCYVEPSSCHFPSSRVSRMGIQLAHSLFSTNGMDQSQFSRIHECGRIDRDDPGSAWQASVIDRERRQHGWICDAEQSPVQEIGADTILRGRG